MSVLVGKDTRLLVQGITGSAKIHRERFQTQYNANNSRQQIHNMRVRLNTIATPFMANTGSSHQRSSGYKCHNSNKAAKTRISTVPYIIQ